MSAPEPVYVFIAGADEQTRTAVAWRIKVLLRDMARDWETDDARVRSTEDPARSIRFQSLTSHEG